jgi:hypothetical protein
MKKIITFLLTIVSLNSYSQKVDTVKNSIQITPIVTNTMKADTAYQLGWRIIVERGSTNDGYCYVTLYSRQGNKIQDFSLYIPYSTMNIWLDDKVIDDFILTKYKLTLRK